MVWTKEFDNPMWNLSLNSDILKGALKCGSSKQGNAFRAVPGPNTVAANKLQNL